VRLQKAQGILAQMENPILLQAGVITPMNMANALKNVYQLLDIENWQELVTFPQPKQQPPPPPPPVKMNLDEFTPLEQAQSKQKYGIQPDMHGMMLQQQDATGEKGIDHEHDLAKAHLQHAQALQQVALQQEHERNMGLLQAASAGVGQQGGDSGE